MALDKTKPLDKALVVQFRGQLVDIVGRKNALSGTHSVRIPSADTLTEQDIVLSTTPIGLLGIKNALLIYSYTPFKMKIVANSVESEEITCSGTFLFFGALDSVSLYASAETRISVLYS